MPNRLQDASKILSDNSEIDGINEAVGIFKENNPEDFLLHLLVSSFYNNLIFVR